MSKVITPPAKSKTTRPKQRPAPSIRPTPESVPPLNNGDRFSRPEFERRYAAQPDIKKAELIEGVVYIMPSPVRIKQHGEPHSWLVGWLFNYMVTTPGTQVADNGTVRLDLDNETQPDAILRIREALGGNSHLADDDYLEGAPELIAEVAASTAAYDLHDKLRAYQRNGVQEYLVFLTYEQEVRWHVLRNGRYEQLAADEQGILRSQVFPGLWLHPTHFWAGDASALIATLQEGIQSPEHASFVDRLQQAGGD